MIKPSVKVRVPKIDIKQPTKAEWAKVGNFVADEVEGRTESGRDADNRRFKPYTRSYAKAKGQTRVDLSVKGHMLGAMRNRPTSTGVKVQIAGGREGYKAWKIQNKQKRVFMAVNKHDVKTIKKLIVKWIAQRNN